MSNSDTIIESANHRLRGHIHLEDDGPRDGKAWYYEVDWVGPDGRPDRTINSYDYGSFPLQLHPDDAWNRALAEVNRLLDEFTRNHADLPYGEPCP